MEGHVRVEFEKLLHVVCGISSYWRDGLIGLVYVRRDGIEFLL